MFAHGELAYERSFLSRSTLQEIIPDRIIPCEALSLVG